MNKVELNVAVEPELVEQAERLGISIAGMSEVQLRLHLQKINPAGAEARARRWADENTEAIKVHNEFVAKHGLLSDHLRPWWL